MVRSATPRAGAPRLRTVLIVSSVVAVIVLAGGIGVVAAVGAAVRAFADGTKVEFAPQLCVNVGPRWDDEQLANAAVIVRAGSDLGLSARDQAIGVMTAMGESSLRNLPYGDWETSGVTNPDGSRTTSIGLFQQQDGWGTHDERMDPYTSATLFYRAMLARAPEPERLTLAPTLVAHRTQVNLNPQHYARFWREAVGVVEELTGADTGLLPEAAPARETAC